MPKDIHDLAAQVNAKPGYVATKNANDNSLLPVTKNGGVRFTRVVYEQSTDRVFIHDGPNVAVGDATAWLNSLK